MKTKISTEIADILKRLRTVCTNENVSLEERNIILSNVTKTVNEIRLVEFHEFEVGDQVLWRSASGLEKTGVVIKVTHQRIHVKRDDSGNIVKLPWEKVVHFTKNTMITKPKE